MVYEKINDQWVSVTPVYNDKEGILSFIKRSGIKWREAVSYLREVADCIEANEGYPTGQVWFW